MLDEASACHTQALCGRLLQVAQVVGVTCFSAMQAMLEGQAFDVVVLDECSQMTEPVSLIPLLQAKARLLVAAGDPCQLPPVISSPAQVTAAGGGGQGQQQGLLRPLFMRLAEMGHSCFLLRRQYRCHPQLSRIPNQCFYQGALLPGCLQHACHFLGLLCCGWTMASIWQCFHLGCSLSAEGDDEYGWMGVIVHALLCTRTHMHWFQAPAPRCCCI